MEDQLFSKILLVFKHMGLAAYSTRTYFRQQKQFIFPAVIRHWELHRAGMVDELKQLDDIAICGDGCFDSMGHSAKYGAYSIFCSDISKVVHSL